MASIITMPKLSPTMEEGVLAKWTKKEGDKIAPGDIIAEVETDKANMEFPLEDDGVLLKLLVKEGDTVKLGDPVAILGEAGESVDEVMKEVRPSAASPQPSASQQSAGAPSAPAVAATARVTAGAQEPGQTGAPDPKRAAAATAATTARAAAAPSVRAQPAADRAAMTTNGDNGHGRVLASPFARKLALEKGVDLRSISGSGPHGRIIKRDIDAAEARGPEAPDSAAVVPSRDDQLVAASQMRKTIARRLVEAKREIPHIYLTADATVDKLFAVREQINDAGDTKVSINDLVVKALALALRKVPAANVSWTSDGILHHGGVHVGMAVSLPDNGLITPVVRDADLKSIGVLARETKALVERARARKLKPEEFSGGSATVSNLGMYGVREFVAIINPPESVILAVGATEKRAIVVDKEGRDSVEIARRMTLTLSCDHRVVDGVLGAQLLAEVVKLLEKPMGMLL